MADVKKVDITELLYSIEANIALMKEVADDIDELRKELGKLSTSTEADQRFGDLDGLPDEAPHGDISTLIPVRRL